MDVTTPYNPGKVGCAAYSRARDIRGNTYAVWSAAQCHYLRCNNIELPGRLFERVQGRCGTILVSTCKLCAEQIEKNESIELRVVIKYFIKKGMSPTEIKADVDASLSEFAAEYVNIEGYARYCYCGCHRYNTRTLKRYIGCLKAINTLRDDSIDQKKCYRKYACKILRLNDTVKQEDINDYSFEERRCNTAVYLSFQEYHGFQNEIRSTQLRHVVSQCRKKRYSVFLISENKAIVDERFRNSKEQDHKSVIGHEGQAAAQRIVGMGCFYGKLRKSDMIELCCHNPGDLRNYAVKLTGFLELGKDAATLPPRAFDGHLSIILNEGCDWLLTIEDKISVTDFHLFPALKAALSGRHFQNNDEMEQTVRQFLASQGTEFYE
ncbi:hypothetical protein ANN_06663 [Periplaneta americana]|uniref:Uncharacterized protein n=1 Tax=Periplaneta americana TaxID=6978 RepID=A0ABQ8TE63_PERAM|nr:hypothetical protein ANN_06663 [Periplaneta americana]